MAVTVLLDAAEEGDLAMRRKFCRACRRESMSAISDEVFSSSCGGGCCGGSGCLAGARDGRVEEVGAAAGAGPSRGIVVGRLGLLASPGGLRGCGNTEASAITTRGKNICRELLHYMLC